MAKKKNPAKQNAQDLASAFIEAVKQQNAELAASGATGIDASYSTGLNSKQDQARKDVYEKNYGPLVFNSPGPNPVNNSPAPAPTIEQQTAAYNQDVLNSMQGLPQIFAEDIGGAIGYRGALRDYFAKTLPGLDTEGLTEADYAELDSQNLADRKNVESYMRSLLQDTTGRLRSQGFASSNLAGRELNRSVYKPLGDTLVNLDAAQAQRRQNILNARAGRRNQTFGTMLTSVGVLGQGSPAQLSSSFVSPSLYGGFTAPQAFDAANSLRGGDVGLQTGFADTQLGGGLRPTTRTT